MADTIAIRVAGREFGGWTGARVVRSIEALAGSFELDATERWAGGSWPLGEGDSCEVVVNGQPVVTGWIDARDRAFGASMHSVGVRGRDRAGDLVDCSVVLDRWEFADTPVLTLAQRLCEPYGITVALQPGLVVAALPKKYSVDPGDTVANALENLCRTAAVLPVSDGLGGLVLTRAGTAPAPADLVEGVNLLGGRSSFDWTGRARRYLVLGTHKGSDALNGAALRIQGDAYDLEARAGRTIVVRPEGNVTAAQAQARAQWEAITRAARSEVVTVDVQGWSASGQVWTPNTRANVRAPSLGVDGSMLITQVELTRDSAGTRASLTLKRPDAFLPQATIPPGGAGGNNYWKEIVRGV